MARTMADKARAKQRKRNAGTATQTAKKVEAGKKRQRNQGTDTSPEDAAKALEKKRKDDAIDLSSDTEEDEGDYDTESEGEEGRLIIDESTLPTPAPPTVLNETKEKRQPATVYISGIEHDFVLEYKRNSKEYDAAIDTHFGPDTLINFRGRYARLTIPDEDYLLAALAVNNIKGRDVVVSRPWTADEKKTQRAVPGFIPPSLRGPAGPDSYIPDRCKVVISGVATSWTDDEIKQNTKADYAQRLIKKNGESRTPTTVVILGYKNGLETKPPAAVRLGHIQYKTRPFIPLPTRCFRCQRFNHTAAKCQSTEVRCVRCGGGHEFKDCDRKDHPKCANCGGPHSTAAPICPTFLREKAAKKIERLEAIPYYKATRAAKKQQQETQRSDVQQPARVKPGPARPAWTTTESGDSPEQPAQPIQRQRRQVITVQPPVVDMDTQTTTPTHADDYNQQIEKVATNLRQKIDNITGDIQKRMDDIADKMEKKMNEIVTDTKRQLEEFATQLEAQHAKQELQLQAMKGEAESWANHNTEVQLTITGMMKAINSMRQQQKFILKAVRVNSQLNRRQTRTDTSNKQEEDQLCEMIADIDQRNIQLDEDIKTDAAFIKTRLAWEETDQDVINYRRWQEQRTKKMETDQQEESQTRPGI